MSEEEKILGIIIKDLSALNDIVRERGVELPELSEVLDNYKLLKLVKYPSPPPNSN